MIVKTNADFLKFLKFIKSNRVYIYIVIIQPDKWQRLHVVTVPDSGFVGKRQTHL